MTPASAQESTEREPVDVVVHGEPPPAPAFGPTRAVSHLERDEIVDSPAASVPDALRRTTGVAVQQTTPGQGTVYVRGMSSREVLVLVDGVRLNGSLYRAGNNPYLGLVDPYALEEVLVRRGTSGVLHGSDALGGVLELRTPLPGYALVEGGRSTLRSLQRVWTNGPGAASRLSAEHAAEDWSAHVGVTTIHQGDIRPGQGTRTPVPISYAWAERPPDGTYAPETSSVQRGTRFRAYFANVALRRRVGRGADVVLRGQVGSRPRLDRHDQVTPRFKRSYPSRARSVVEPMSRGMVSLAWSKRWAGAVLDKLRVSLAWQRLAEEPLRRGLDETCVGGPDPSADPCTTRLRLTPSSTVERERNRADALSFRSVAQSESADRRTTFWAGVDGVYDRVASQAWASDVRTGAVTQQPARYPDGSAQSRVGAFVRGELEVLPSLRAYAGVRGGVFHLDIRSRPDEQSPALEREVADWAASSGLRWDFAPRVAWMVNVGRGIRAVNVHDLATLGPRAGGRFQVPNEELTPEHSLSVDTGIKLDRGGVRAETFVFALRHEDAILLAPTAIDGETTSPAGDPYYTSINASTVEILGIEGSWRFALTPRYGLFATALAIFGTQTNPEGLALPEETPADRVPPPQGTLGAWIEPDRDVRVEVFATGAIAQARLNDPTNLRDNRIPKGGTPGYVTVHGTIAWAAARSLTLRLAFDNVTDRRVLEHGSGYYAPGFNAMAGADFHID